MRIIIISFVTLLVIYPLSAGAWTWTADFESGTLDAAAEGASGLTQANEEGSTCNTYSNAQASSGTQSMRNYFVSGDTGSPGSSNATGGHITYPSQVAGEGSEIWGRMYLYLPTGGDWSWACSPVVKVFRLAHIYASGGEHRGYISIFANSSGEIVLSNELDDQINHERATSATFTNGVWQCIEIYIKLSSTSGEIRIWKDGVLAREETNYRTLRASDDYLSEALVWTYWNGGHPQNQYAWVDDIAITNEQPSNQDTAGNYMIGPLDWEDPDTTPPTCTGCTGVGVTFN